MHEKMAEKVAEMVAEIVEETVETVEEPEKENTPTLHHTYEVVCSKCLRNVPVAGTKG